MIYEKKEDYMLERINKEYLKEIVIEAIKNKHDFLILNFQGLNRDEVSEKIKNITLNKKRTYIVLTGIEELEIRTEDFLEIYNQIYLNKVSLMIC